MTYHKGFLPFRRILMSVVRHDAPFTMINCSPHRQQQVAEVRELRIVRPHYHLRLEIRAVEQPRRLKPARSTDRTKETRCEPWRNLMNNIHERLVEKRKEPEFPVTDRPRLTPCLNEWSTNTTQEDQETTRTRHEKGIGSPRDSQGGGGWRSTLTETPLGR